jgi:hypothetical protein
MGECEEYLLGLRDELPDPETVDEWKEFSTRWPEEAWRFRPTEENMDMIKEPTLIDRAAQRRLIHTLKSDPVFLKEMLGALGIEA